MNLSDSTICAAAAGTKPIRMFDGGGLYLEVSPAGGKLWRMKYRFSRKEKLLSFGSYPNVSIEEARQRRDAAHSLLAEGIDPGEQMKLEKAEARSEQDRLLKATRFTLDNDGALAVRLGARRFSLSPAETLELRSFLDATSNLACKR